MPEPNDLPGRIAPTRPELRPEPDTHRFAAFLSLQDQPALLVGGGQRLMRKLDRLLEAGARVTVVACNPCSELQQRIEAGVLQHSERPEPTDEQLRNAQLVLIGTSDAELDQSIAHRARTFGRLVNVADNPASSSYLIPSLVKRGPVRIAISSGGTSPVLARLLRARIEAFVPHSFAVLAQLAARFNQTLRARITHPASRRRFWENTLGGRLGDLMLGGDPARAEARLHAALAEFDGTPVSTHERAGEVFLVGAGPGDPDLLSFRALRLMQQADVVLYDRLVSSEILALVRQEAEHVYVGKQRSEHAVPQENINALLVKFAQQGKRVLRLKGGDPFIFGRGGEEIGQLAAEGIAFQVVPGITAAAGCASYAGIPLTHRDHSQACIFVTGHLKDGSIDLNWPMLAQPNQTVVVYMGLAGLPVICSQLIEHGLPAATPIALVAEGTTARQQVLTGTLTSLPVKVQQTPVQPPTLLIIGQVVQLREQLKWFRTRGGLNAVEAPAT